MDIGQNRLWLDIQELERIRRSPDGGIVRLAFTPQDRQAQDWLGARMRGARLAVREDTAGDLIGGLYGSRPGKPCVICGSHYGTVPGGGQFDGTLGALSALEAMRRIREQGTATGRTIHLAAFKDEEGSRFGYGMVNSKSIYGIPDPEGLTSVDKSGTPPEQTTADHGYRPGQLASCKTEDMGTYPEFHIEQGKMLEGHGASIGVVSDIAGPVRCTMGIRGKSGYAGATPVKARKDLVPAMYRWIDRVTELAGARESCVITVGPITAYPGARNVICECVVFSLDLRSIRQEDLRKVVEETKRYGAELSSLHGMKMSLRSDQALPPCRCHEPSWEAIKNICRSEGYSFMELMSGIGHDCMNLRDMCPTAVISVSSEGGVSYRKGGFTSREDCIRGAGVLLELPLETADVSDKINWQERLLWKN